MKKYRPTEYMYRLKGSPRESIEMIDVFVTESDVVNLLKEIEGEVIKAMVWDSDMDKAIKSIIQKHIKKLE